jgi:NAD(P)-dependent dehydrogenase (short-subunit alcohol dehydrogenase family)
MSLAGKVVLVTGAGSGIGSAVARHLVQAVASVVLVGRREAALNAVSSDCLANRSAEPRGQLLVMRADVGDSDEVDRVVEEALRCFGRLDGLVNNAGVARFAGIEDADLGDLDAMLNANLRGPVYLIRACLPALRQRSGAIVNVSSIGGVVAMPGRSLYGATKAALNSLTRSLARELAPSVRVNAVLPGPVDTPMYDDLGLSFERTEQLRRQLEETTPMGRFGQPEEIARWVCSLLDEDVSGWVTGTLMCVDGGRAA